MLAGSRDEISRRPQPSISHTLFVCIPASVYLCIFRVPALLPSLYLSMSSSDFLFPAAIHDQLEAWWPHWPSLLKLGDSLSVRLRQPCQYLHRQSSCFRRRGVSAAHLAVLAFLIKQVTISSRLTHYCLLRVIGYKFAICLFVTNRNAWTLSFLPWLRLCVLRRGTKEFTVLYL